MPGPNATSSSRFGLPDPVLQYQVSSVWSRRDLASWCINANQARLPIQLSCTFWFLTSFRTQKILESLWKLNLLWGRGVFTVLLEFQAGSGVTLLTFVPLVTLVALVKLVALVALAMRAILARKLGAFALISLRARYGLGRWAKPVDHTKMKIELM